jgi:enterochelin esterase-like enzyme
MQEMSQTFEDDLTQALIPYIDSNFRTIADREHRAMAGLSMGACRPSWSHSITLTSSRTLEASAERAE